MHLRMQNAIHKQYMLHITPLHIQLHRLCVCWNMCRWKFVYRVFEFGGLSSLVAGVVASTKPNQQMHSRERVRT